MLRLIVVVFFAVDFKAWMDYEVAIQFHWIIYTNSLASFIVL